MAEKEQKKQELQEEKKRRKEERERKAREREEKKREKEKLRQEKAMKRALLQRNKPKRSKKGSRGVAKQATKPRITAQSHSEDKTDTSEPGESFVRKVKSQLTLP